MEWSINYKCDIYTASKEITMMNCDNIENIKIFGLLRYVYEGEDEKYIQNIKSEISNIQNNIWWIVMTLKISRSFSVESINLLCDFLWCDPRLGRDWLRVGAHLRVFCICELFCVHWVTSPVHIASGGALAWWELNLLCDLLRGCVIRGISD